MEFIYLRIAEFKNQNNQEENMNVYEVYHNDHYVGVTADPDIAEKLAHVFTVVLKHYDL